MTPEQNWRPWDELTPAQRRRRSETAAWATLERHPASPAAEALVAAVLDGTIIPAKQTKLRTPLRPSSLQELRDATGAILGDLLAAAAQDWAVKRSVRKDAFTGLRIGRTAWTNVTAPMIAAGLLDYAHGQAKAPGSMMTSRAAVFSATPKLVKLAVEHNIELATIGRHFQRQQGTSATGSRRDDTDISLP